MARTKTLARMALFAAATALCACGSDENGNSQSDVGLGLDTPVLWNDPSGGAAPPSGTLGDTPLQWIDPNLATGGTGGVFVISLDERFYDTPFQPGNVVYINVHHPIMTHTTDTIITNPELNCMAMINSIRQNVNGGNVGGGNNGVPINNIPQLLFSNNLRKSARALCKHYVLFHSNDNFTALDPEGQTFAAGAPGPEGRNGKGLVGATGTLVEDVLADPNWTNPGNVGREFANRNMAVVTNPLLRYQGVGHWRGGRFLWYWSLLIVSNVPA